MVYGDYVSDSVPGQISVLSLLAQNEVDGLKAKILPAQNGGYHIYVQPSHEALEAAYSAAMLAVTGLKNMKIALDKQNNI